MLLVLLQIVTERRPSIGEKVEAPCLRSQLDKVTDPGHGDLCLPWTPFPALTMDPENFLSSPESRSFMLPS